MGRNFTPEQRAQQARQRAAEKSAEQLRAQTHKARLANAERRIDRAIAKRYPHAKGCLTLDMQGGNHCECGATDARRRHKEETMSEGTERYFPVLRHDRYASYGCPDKVPWELVAAHEPQAYQNHGQTVQRLADRGGLDPTELVAVLQDRRWRPMGPAAASEHLLALVKRHEEFLKPVLGDPAMGVQVSRRFVPLEPGVEWKEGFTSYGFPIPRNMREENDAELAKRIREQMCVGELRPVQASRVWLVRSDREVDTSDGFTAPTGEIVAVFASFGSAEEYVGTHPGTLLEDPDGHEVKP